MNFLSLSFFLFLFAFLIIYYIIPQRFRYIVIFCGSLFFYGFSNPSMLAILLIASIISYIGGLVYKLKKKKIVYILFFALEIILLCLFKYTLFVIENINGLLSLVNASVEISIPLSIIMPVGLSFIVFQACAYLSDVYRGNIDVETNPIKLFAFVAFFPTVLSGPIQKARTLIPQISSPSMINFEQFQKGILLILWGIFEKILVANRLQGISTVVITDYANRSSAELLIGIICFSLYIYADFSSYSDMARGIGKLLGIDIGKNFQNPYLSVTVSEFWNRWHISLNEWFRENVYIPLGGNKKGKIRKYINILIVFGISGLWHGANWHFVAWGIVNGMLAIVGQALFPIKESIYKRLNINEDVESIIVLKRIIVFGLISLTWVLFSTSVRDSIGIWYNLVFFNVISIFNPELLNIAGSAVMTFFCIISTAVFCYIQFSRRDETTMFIKYRQQPFIIQCMLASCILIICVFAACNTDTVVDTQFIYFQF